MERLLVCLLLTRPWARFRSDFFSGFVKQRMICNAQLIAKVVRSMMLSKMWAVVN